MNEEYSNQGIIDIGERFKEDIDKGQFNNFLFVTYRIDPELVDWFPPQSHVVICTPSEEASKIAKSDFSDKNVTTVVLDSHAKIYLMWNARKIKCWLGSFNFTSGGLFESIEWATTFEGDLSSKLRVKDILNHDLSPSLTNSIIINQILDLVNSKIRRKNPELSDNVFQNTSFDMILLHNQGTDTLSKSISRILSDADRGVRIEYFTPYMNKTGILDFCRTFPKLIPLVDVEFRVFTNKPSIHYETGTFLKSRDIQNIKNKLAKFVLLKRKTKDGGTTLSDGTEISGDFLHLKLIHVSFRDKKGVRKQHSIFTSANLTESVWGGTGENLEIGLWVRDHTRNKVIGSFIKNFSVCFSEPDEDELKEIDETMEAVERKKKTEDYWIEDFLEDHIRLSSDSITISWENSLPTMRDVKCKLRLRDIVTGELSEEIIQLEKSDRSFTGRMECLTRRKNTAIDYIELMLRTNFEPPEVAIRSKFLKKYLVQHDGKSFLRFEGDIRGDWSEVIINGNAYPVNNHVEIEISDKKINSISLRELSDSMKDVKVLIKIKEQPHLNGKFFIGSRVSLESVRSFKKLIRIDLDVNEVLDSPFDTIGFLSPKSKWVEYVGFSKNGSRLTYYFKQDLNYTYIKAVIKPPYSEYFKQAIKLELPKQKTHYKSKIWNVLSQPFSHRLAKLDLEDQTLADKCISEHSRIMIEPLHKLLETFSSSQIKYIYKEDSLFYRPPIFCNMTDEITGSEPYSRISYWGVVQVADGKKEINFLTSKNSFLVRKSMIRKIPINDKQKIPMSLPISKMKNDDPIAWIILNQKDIELSDENLRKRLQLQVWKNEKKMDEKDLGILRFNLVYCIPIFKREINTQVDFLFVLKYDENDTFLSNFSWAIRKEQYKIRRTKGKVIKIRHGNEEIPIYDRNDANLSELYFEGSFVSRHILERMSRKTGLLRYVPDYNKVHLCPTEDVLIRLKPTIKARLLTSVSF